MHHEMKLYESGFRWIREWKQTIEVRLFDEKRRKIAVWDSIAFLLLPDLKEKVAARAIWLIRRPTFQELFECIPLKEWNADGWTIEKCVECCRHIYSEEEERRNGVLAIKLQLTEK